MGKKDPRVDAYIAKCGDFAQPILKELRARMHADVPGVAETIRWGAPYFEYGGSLVGGMAAFKHHCGFGFWHPLLRDGDTSLEGLGGFGRIESVSELPSKAAFTRLAKTAKQLIDDGVKGPPRPRTVKKEIVVPDDLAGALRRNAKARATFDGFSYSHRKEYVDWINGAKRDATRAQRLATTVEWLSQGKTRMWKYERR